MTKPETTKTSDNKPELFETPDRRFDVEGQKLWDWLEGQFGNFDLETVKPLAMELCRVADRLAKVRGKIDQLVDIAPSGTPVRLLQLELRLSEQFGKHWRSLGLADPPQEVKRPVGRPPHSTREFGG